jgi:hypothetical protein
MMSDFQDSRPASEKDGIAVVDQRSGSLPDASFLICLLVGT